MAGFQNPGGVARTTFEHVSKNVHDRDGNALFHDDLASHPFCAVLFRQFIAEAMEHGLQFLSESSLGKTLLPDLDAQTASEIERLSGGDTVKYQQYLDFVLFTGLRKTLLCRREIEVNRKDIAERLPGLLVASALQGTPSARSGMVAFRNPLGFGTFESDDKLLVSAIALLEQKWPLAIPFEELLNSCSVIPGLAGDLRVPLTQRILRLASSKLVDLRTHQFPVADSIPERPLASPLARLQATLGNRITTLLHGELHMKDPQQRAFLVALDGTRTVEDLVRAFGPGIRAELMQVHKLGLLIAR